MAEIKGAEKSPKYPHAKTYGTAYDGPCIYLMIKSYVVARAGVQPATFALGVRRSMQLSYRAISTSVP